MKPCFDTVASIPGLGYEYNDADSTDDRNDSDIFNLRCYNEPHSDHYDTAYNRRTKVFNSDRKYEEDWWNKQNERIKMQIRGWLKENTKSEMYNVQRNREK